MQIGNIIKGRYRVTDVINTGGMSTIYRAQDTISGNSEVCVKEMDPLTLAISSNLTRGEFIARFEEEIRTLEKLKHARIPKIYEHFIDPRQVHYLVMEWIDGQTLEDYAGPKPKMSELEVCQIAVQILEVLVYLHGLKHPIVYRDLKPSNVMVTKTPKLSGYIRLVDFGIAKEMINPGMTQVAPGLTQGIGTLGYAPPEQAAGVPATRSDVYALGYVMYFLLTGDAPPVTMNLSKQRPDVSKELAALLVQATDQQTKQRPSSIEMKTELERHLQKLQTPNPALTRIAPLAQMAPAVPQASSQPPTISAPAAGVPVAQTPVNPPPQRIQKPAVTPVVPGVNIPSAPSVAAATDPLAMALATIAKVAQKSAGVSANANQISALPPTMVAMPVGLPFVQPPAQPFKTHLKTTLLRASARITSRLFETDRQRLVNCQRYLDPNLYTWKSASRKAQAEALLSAIRYARSQRTPVRIINQYYDGFWNLVFEDELEALGVILERTDILPNQNPPLFAFLPGIGLGRLLRWLRRDKTPVVSVTSLTNRAFEVTKILREAQVGSLTPAKIGISRYCLGVSWLTYLYVLVGNVWYRVVV